MVETTRFVRKPLYVDAIRVSAGNFDTVAAWCEGTIHQAEPPNAHKNYIKVNVSLAKNVRQTQAFVGDWILSTERGYKVYTNKAFRTAFDEVPSEPKTTEPVSDPRLTGNPVVDRAAEATSEQIAEAVADRVIAKPTEELVREMRIDLKPVDEIVAVTGLTREEVEEILKPSHPVEVAPELLEDAPPPIDAAVKHQLAEAHLHSVSAVPEDPNPSNGVQPIDSVKPLEQVDSVEDVRKQESVVPAAVEGKRVLSVEEQKEMDADEVRELIRSGEVVLAQDIAQP